MAPFGHFILADIYNRQGRMEDAERELHAAQRFKEQNPLLNIRRQ